VQSAVFINHPEEKKACAFVSYFWNTLRLPAGEKAITPHSPNDFLRRQILHTIVKGALLDTLVGRVHQFFLKKIGEPFLLLL
jgi:hypothetical protein